MRINISSVDSFVLGTDLSLAVLVKTIMKTVHRAIRNFIEVNPLCTVEIEGAAIVTGHNNGTMEEITSLELLGQIFRSRQICEFSVSFATVE